MITFHVSEFVDFLREHLRTTIGEVVVQGEVSGYRERGDNLIFFDLKDQESSITCFMLKYELTQPIEDGIEVKVLGIPSFFKKTGKFHLRAKEIQLLGSGALMKAFLALKLKLEQEGLFAQQRKRLLPRFPDRIGLITSSDAAAYTDVLKTLKRRWKAHTIVFAPVRVQGAGSVRDIVKAIQAVNAYALADVVILTRGGGSLEDLQSYNTEDVARAIVASKAPVVAGIGHERDLTIAEMVADMRASTPTAAAELVAPDRRDLGREIEALHRQSAVAFGELVRTLSVRVDVAVERLQANLRQRELGVENLLQRFRTIFVRFVQEPKQRRLQIEHLTQRLGLSAGQWVARLQQQLDSRRRLLESFNPRGILKRGYSMTFDAAGKIIHDADSVKKGERIETQVSKGSFTSDVV